MAGRFFGFGIQFRHILAVKFYGDIGFRAGHQFVEAQLDRLAEVELGALYRVECRLHLLDHFRPG